MKLDGGRIKNFPTTNLFAQNISYIQYTVHVESLYRQSYVMDILSFWKQNGVQILFISNTKMLVRMKWKCCITGETKWCSNHGLSLLYVGTLG